MVDYGSCPRSRLRNHLRFPGSDLAVVLVKPMIAAGFSLSGAEGRLYVVGYLSGKQLVVGLKVRLGPVGNSSG